MSEDLKTLKDLERVKLFVEGEYKDIEFVSNRELRQEAKKWIKHYKKFIEGEREKCSLEQRDIDVIQAEAMIVFIKHFFNIDEEEIEDE